VTASPSTSPTAAQQVVSDDRVLLRADPERDVLERDPLHHMVKGRGIGIDQLHRVGHDRGRERPALLSGGLVALVEHPQQLRVRGEHPGVEAGGDLLGMRCDDCRGRLHHGLRLGR